MGAASIAARSPPAPENTPSGMNSNVAGVRAAAAAAFHAERQLYRHPASFGLHLSQQRRLLFGRPFPPPLNPRNDLHVHRSGLLLELQKEAPQVCGFRSS